MSKQFLSDMTSLLVADGLCARKMKAFKHCFEPSVNSSFCDGSSTSAVRSCQSLVSLLRVRKMQSIWLRRNQISCTSSVGELRMM